VRHHAFTLLSLLLFVVGLGMAPARAAEQRAFSIQEPFGVSWGPDRVSYAVAFPQGAVLPKGVALTDEAGQPAPVQLSDIVLWPDKSVKSATVSFMVTLAPDQKKSWMLAAGRRTTRTIKTTLAARLDAKAGVIQLENDRSGVRLPGGVVTYPQPVDGTQLPAPIQGVKLSDGRWIGKGSWQTDVKCTGYSATITDAGPVFVRARLRYEFAGGKNYTATVELNAGQELAVVTESFNLAAGTRYPMRGLPGMQPGDTFAYVMPTFTSPDRALIWDWWSQTMAMLPTPNQYLFSFEDMKADRVEFSGRNSFGNIIMPKPVPEDQIAVGEVRCDKDGRFMYLNCFPQWGDEEVTFAGLFNAQTPTTMLAVTGLRPSQWLHPDIDPHPTSTIKQYVQTNCITFERRTSGAMFFRAPACLGKRVYGIGGMARTVAPHVVPHRSNGPSWSEPVLGDDLSLLHVRMGRLELNTVKDWVLDYPETSKYPRLFVPEGDRARYESRKTRKPLDEVQKLLEAKKAPTAADEKLVADAITRTSKLVRFFAQAQKGLMDYGLDEDPISTMAEAALANPACTPEQAKELRKWLSAIAYYAIDEDFVPGRDKGFGWGSANQFAQVQCRTCYIAALLPNHPLGKTWRRHLAKIVTMYLTDQVNAAGVTLECPHYGGMEIEMPVLALTALANCGDVDLSEATTRLRAAAKMRLATQLPWDIRGGFRAESPKGDGYYMPEYTFPSLIGYFQKSDPDLVKHLVWACQEGGLNLNSPYTTDINLVDVGLPAEEPKLGSQHFPGFGMVLRNGFPRHDEACLQISADGWDWGHGHNDRGSWILYAKGAPLMVDFAAMYTPSMRELWLHPGGLTFDHDETVRPVTDDPKDDWWHKCANADYRTLTTAPFTDVEPFMHPSPKDELDRWGQVTAFTSRPQADYAEMQRRMGYLRRVPYLLQPVHGKDLFDDSPGQEIYLKQPFLWTRRFVFVKDADPQGHNYLVIRDTLPGNTELTPYLNLWCLASKVDIAGQTVVYTGQHGVDLHCYIAEPTTFTAKTRTVGHPCGFSFAQYYQKTFGKPFREDQVQVQIPQAKKDGGYFVVMVPVKQGEAAPTFATLAGGKAVRVTFPDRVDTIVLQGAGEQTVIDGRTFATPAGLAVQRGERVEMVDLTGK
jgi:hypothetical protein